MRGAVVTQTTNFVSGDAALAESHTCALFPNYSLSLPLANLSTHLHDVGLTQQTIEASFLNSDGNTNLNIATVPFRRARRQTQKGDRNAR
jgi:hypothetical protein